jgi:glycosyltransferase involved in cell wall biosynthesis
MLDKTKLSKWELDNYDKILEIEANMTTEKDKDFIEKFFEDMWEHFDYKVETRPVIILSTPSKTGTDWFRLRVPLYDLWKRFGDKYYFIFTDKFNVNMIKFADLIIQHRAGEMHLWQNKIETMWPKGNFKKPVICHDVDDNEFNLPDSHPLKQMWIATGKDKMSMSQLLQAHQISTTGRTLKTMFSKFGAFNKIDVLPNAFQWKQKQWKELSWEDKEKTKPELGLGKVTVGWAGLTSHFPDLTKMLSIFKKAQKHSDDLYFILSGMPTNDQVNLPDADGNMVSTQTPQEHTYKYKILHGFKYDEKNKFEGYVPALGKDNVIGQDVKDLHNYGEFYDQYDINVAYLAEKSSFNKAKSPIKVIEGFRKKAVCVWTQWGGYQDFWYNLPPNLKKIATAHMACDSDKKMAENITFWAKNPEYRKEVAELFFNYVTEEFGIETVNNKRIQLYEKLLKEK